MIVIKINIRVIFTPNLDYILIVFYKNREKIV